MSIDPIEAADLFDTLSRLLRNPSLPLNPSKTKALILASANAGIRGLQSALGVQVDGIFGSITEAALNDIDVDDLIASILSIPRVPVPMPAPIPVPVPVPEPMPAPTPAPDPTPSTPVPNAAEYAQHFVAMTIDSNRLAEVKAIARKIQHYETLYQQVANAIGATYWPLIGIIHNLESSINFGTHLYNGDPLSGRTIHHPKGRPTEGNPPFAWEYSAIDALRYVGFDKWHDWTLLGMAYMLEKYNGMGYRNHHVPSPYLWAGSNIYTRGYYTSDGVFDPNAVSRQIGGMTMLKYFFDQGVTTTTSTNM